MSRLIFRTTFLVLCAIAAVLPLSGAGDPPAPGSYQLANWPVEFEGTQLQSVPLSEPEARFNAGFPGQIAKFTAGRRQLILRRVTTATRKLHSAADCFRGLGYAVTPQPAMRDAQGQRWSCFLARRGGGEFVVRERIVDSRGGEWTDVSSWFWSVLLRRTTGPWTACTVVETDAG